METTLKNLENPLKNLEKLLLIFSGHSYLVDIKMKKKRSFLYQ